MKLNKNKVTKFEEKKQLDDGWINGGFFVCSKSIKSYLGEGNEMFERDPLIKLSIDEQLYAYKHEGFWQCMDTKKERDFLDNLASSEIKPWRKL
jgi:glucose-1-phosphate cytidylyltransferase